MPSRAPLVACDRGWKRRARLVGTVLAGAVATIVTAAWLLALVSNLPGFGRRGERVALRLHNLPPGDEFASINRVAQWPTDWIAAVCEPPVYHLRAPNARFPHATASAVCKARVQPNGEYAEVVFTFFTAELPMQVDLFNNNYKWYAFAYDHGEMITFATYCDAEVVDPNSSFSESPVLQPLERFGFNIYSRPGP